MNLCRQIERVDSYLDGELAPAEAEAFRAHLAGCAECASELALVERAIAAVERARTWDPGPAFTERVMSAVLPSRVRSRWMRRLGVGYAAAASVGVAVFAATIVSQPAAREACFAVSSAAVRGLIQGIVLVLEGAAGVLMSLASGWGLVTAAGDRLAPLVRVAGALFGRPDVALTCMIAAAACIVLLRWMRARDSGSSREVHHVGLLAF